MFQFFRKLLLNIVKHYPMDLCKIFHQDLRNKMAQKLTETMQHFRKMKFLWVARPRNCKPTFNS